MNLLLQNIALLFIFTAVYELFYRWNKHFFYNRIYLVVSTILSIVIPFLSFKVFPYKKIVSVHEKSPDIPGFITQPDSFNWILAIYLTVAVIMAIYLAFRIIKVLKLIKNTHFDQEGKLFISYNNNKTFSFFHYLFIKDKEDAVVLRHEKAHTSKNHSLDVVFYEIAKCILWFNPFIYRINFLALENLEFEADFIAMNQNDFDEVAMAEYLLNYAKTNLSIKQELTNNFFSLIKNRIMMLSKNKTSKTVYFLLIPVFLTVFSAFTFKSYPVYQTSDGKIIQDTIIPGKIVTIDTIIIYDPDTKKETMQIDKKEMSMDEYIKDLNFSGKMYEIIDTIVVYDPDLKTEEEYFKKMKIPYELKDVFNTLNADQKMAIIRNYGSEKTIKAK